MSEQRFKGWIIPMIALAATAIAGLGQERDAVSDSPPSSATSSEACFLAPYLDRGELLTVDAGETPEVTTHLREALTRPVRYAWFRGLERLSDEDSLLLSRVPGYVSVGSITSLRVRSAEYFRRHHGVLHFGYVREISDEVAGASQVIMEC
ncbi:MAG: hypothetical protein EBT03_08660 [Betaproteobacteria bacterium]|nr:hypothetical protein [Betaproteobacteria bacterium]NCA17252.1 hypothetical protein [Betaproteobacteria bacterium]